MKLKKRIAAVAVVLSTLAIMAAGTLAYFTDTDEAVNKLTTGEIDIELVEMQDNGEEWPTNGVAGVMPASTISKIVTVDNLSAAPAWVRIKVTTEIIGADDAALPNQITAKDGSTVPVVHLNLKDGWTEIDGWFYCNEPVPAGEESPVLFDSVTFDKDLGNEYQGSKAFVNVYADAVQWANNPVPDGGTLADIAGWPNAVSAE